MSTACPHCPRLKSSAICSKWSVCDSPVARKLFRRSVQTLGHQAKGGTVESVDLPFFSPPWAPSGYRWTTDFQRMTATWAAVGWVGWLGITRLNQEAVMDSAIWPISRLMPWTKERIPANPNDHCSYIIYIWLCYESFFCWFARTITLWYSNITTGNGNRGTKGTINLISLVVKLALIVGWLWLAPQLNHKTRAYLMPLPPGYLT